MELSKAEQQEVDYRQIIFPMRQFHKQTGAVKVFFSLDEWLPQESKYSPEKPALQRGPGRPRTVTP